MNFINFVEMWVLGIYILNFNFSTWHYCSYIRGLENGSGQSYCGDYVGNFAKGLQLGCTGFAKKSRYDFRLLLHHTGVEILFKSHLHMVQVTYWTYLHLAGPTCTLTVHARRYHITFTTLNASSIFMIHHNHV